MKHKERMRQSLQRLAAAREQHVQRIVEVAACSICRKPATTAAGSANEPICAACEAEMMVTL